MSNFHNFNTISKFLIGIVAIVTAFLLGFIIEYLFILPTNYKSYQSDEMIEPVCVRIVSMKEDYDSSVLVPSPVALSTTEK